MPTTDGACPPLPRRCPPPRDERSGVPAATGRARRPWCRRRGSAAGPRAGARSVTRGCGSTCAKGRAGVDSLAGGGWQRTCLAARGRMEPAQGGAPAADARFRAASSISGELARWLSPSSSPAMGRPLPQLRLVVTLPAGGLMAASGGLVPNCKWRTEAA